jgi:hypothetical protein
MMALTFPHQFISSVTMNMIPSLNVLEVTFPALKPSYQIIPIPCLSEHPFILNIHQHCLSTIIDRYPDREAIFLFQSETTSTPHSLTLFPVPSKVGAEHSLERRHLPATAPAIS